MVDPGIGLDQGGNPLQEGIWATTDGGWKSRGVRDESFASVNKTAAGFITYPYSLYDSDNFSPREKDLARIHQNAENIYRDLGWEHAKKHMLSEIDPHHNEYDAPHGIDPDFDSSVANFGQHMIDAHGGDAPSMWGGTEEQAPVAHESLPDDHVLGWEPGMHGRGLIVGDKIHTWNAYDPNEIEHTNNFGTMHADYANELGQRYGIDPESVSFNHGIEINPDGTIDTAPGADLSPYFQADPRLKPGKETWHFGGTIIFTRNIQDDIVLNSRRAYVTADDSWEHKVATDDAHGVLQDSIDEIKPAHSTQVTPGPYGIHNGTVKWLSFIGAHVNGIDSRKDGGKIFQTLGMKNSPEFGKPVTVYVHHKEHLPVAANLIATSAGNQAPEDIKKLAISISQGQAPAPPGIDPAKIRFGQKIAGPLLAIPAALGIGAGEAAGAGLAGSIAGPLMRGALMGAGSQLIQGAMGGGQGASPQVSEPSSVPPRPAEILSSTIIADAETVTSNPGYFVDDPTKADQKEFDSGSTDPNFHNPERDEQAGGSAKGEDAVRAKFSPDSEQKLETLLPILLHFYNSEKSGESDPIVIDIHHQIEKEHPGYIDTGDEEALKAIIGIEKQAAKLAAPFEIQPSTGPMPGMAQQNPNAFAPPAGQHVLQQNHCAFCGGVTTADGSCPQCGATPNPMGGALPQQKSAADHQGPVTPEQQAAVAELLNESGRGEEIPEMIRSPWNYTKEMEQVGHRLNIPPNVDEGTQPPAPAQEEAPPGATMPVPGMSIPPSGGPQAMASRQAADNYAKRCPKCNSSTTGIVSSDGSCECHACGHAWKDQNIVENDMNNKTASPELDDPAPSSATWQDAQGSPLQVGQTYLMKAPNYTIPDRVVIQEIKPTALVVTTQGGDGDSSLSYSNEITKQEADIEGLTFESDGENSNPGEQIQDGQEPINTEVQPEPDFNQAPKYISSSNNSALSWIIEDESEFIKEAGKHYTPREQKEIIEEKGDARNADKLQLEGTHYKSSLDIDEDDISLFW